MRCIDALSQLRVGFHARSREFLLFLMMSIMFNDVVIQTDYPPITFIASIKPLHRNRTLPINLRRRNDGYTLYTTRQRVLGVKKSTPSKHSSSHKIS